MKTTKLLLAGFLVFGSVVMKGQNVASTSTLTSGGSTAGSSGTGGAYYGYEAGKVTTGANNSFFGHQAGKANTTGTHNLFLGHQAGVSNSSGSQNICIGSYSGGSTGTSGSSIYIGYMSGQSNSGGDNVILEPNRDLIQVVVEILT